MSKSAELKNEFLAIRLFARRPVPFNVLIPLCSRDSALLSRDNLLQLGLRRQGEGDSG